MSGKSELRTRRDAAVPPLSTDYIRLSYNTDHCNYCKEKKELFVLVQQ